MKHLRWFLTGIGLILMAAIALNANDNDQRFDEPGKYGGRPLTSAESTTVSRAIDSIGTPPPAVIHYWDANGDSHTVSCSTIAADLRAQLARGAIEAETLNTDIWGVASTDGNGSTSGDEMNVDTSLLGRAARDSSQLVHLEEVLVHEWEHKAEDSTVGMAEGEVNALAKELAYKDSCGLDTSDGLFRETFKDYCARRWNYMIGSYTRRLTRWWETLNFVSFLEFDTTGTGTDGYGTLVIGGGVHSLFPLGPLRAYDLLVYQRAPWLPPDHSFVLICGADPAAGTARMQGLYVADGMVTLSMPPVLFGPPDHPPMSFESMDWLGGFWGGPMVVLDGLNHQILVVLDSDGDMVPDWIQGIYASLMQPGFEPLFEAHGIDWLSNPIRGSGIALSIDEPHIGHDWIPGELLWFLPDADGDMMADACLPVPMYEFMQFKPSLIPPVPWAGDIAVNLHATWHHPIEVWTTDPAGEILMELVGITLMEPGVDRRCDLMRPLLPGERLLALDALTGKRFRTPTMVVDPTPRALVLSLSGNILEFHWQPVAGAAFYTVYVVEGGLETELGTTTATEFSLPLRPAHHEFYVVRAGR